MKIMRAIATVTFIIRKSKHEIKTKVYCLLPNLTYSAIFYSGIIRSTKKGIG